MMVSVVIPTYNRAGRLKETIDAVERNTIPPGEMEILVVDDHSTDDTQATLTTLAAQYGNIRPLSTPSNSGPAAARNLGVKAAQGEFVFFTDDDCLVPPTWIRGYVEYFDAHPNVFGIGGALEPKTNNWVARIERLKNRALGLICEGERIGRKGLPVGFTNNLAYRRSVFSEAGLFDEHFKVPAGEDVEFATRVTARHDVAYLPIPVIHNHAYNIEYLVGILYKQGLERMPPKGRLARWALLALFMPVLLWKTLRKTIRYRSAR